MKKLDSLKLMKCSAKASKCFGMLSTAAAVLSAAAAIKLICEMCCHAKKIV
ncbi:MAG: hypothetical protein ACI4XH_05360 [Acutalibacteraceae bacterium]